MPNTFETLTGFLARHGAEVEGRESPKLPGEMRDRLQAFARGQLPESEQAELVRRINEYPEWVAFLAEEVKALRAPRN